MTRGSFDDFLRHLLALESGLDPALFDWYVEHLDAPVVEYPRAAAVGRVVRDAASGRPLTETMTVRRYFETLGVDDLFDPSCSDCIAQMQYAAVNVLGFVGYQVGESILMATGHYVPARVRWAGGTRDAYYVGTLPDRAWRGGVRQVAHEVPGTGEVVVATDVNAWGGSFTGKDGLRSFADLRTRAVQERVIRAVIRHNHGALGEALARHGTDIASVVATSRSAAGGFSTDRPPWTLSGLLAAAHLCGAGAVADCLVFGRAASDEFGASVLDYAAELGGYQTPYG